MKSTSFEVLNKNVLNLMKDVAIIKEHLEDCFLTAKEEANLEKSLGELEKGETISLEDLEKELNAN